MHPVVNKVAITCPFTPPSCPSCQELIFGPSAGRTSHNLKNPDPHSIYGNSSKVPEQQNSNNTPDGGNANQFPAETSSQVQNEFTSSSSITDIERKSEWVILIQKLWRGSNTRRKYLIMYEEKKKADERAKRIQSMSDLAAKAREERWAREEEESERKRARDERNYLRSITTTYSELVEIFQRGTFGRIVTPLVACAS
jgi:hypothetical protein